MDRSKWPSWLVPAINYLEGVSLNPKWNTLVESFVGFEEGLSFVATMCPLTWCLVIMSDSLVQGRLERSGKPEEVRVWLKNGRKYSVPPKIVNVTEYGQSWR
jgi:hypothetical protein